MTLEIDVLPNASIPVRTCDACGRPMIKATKVYRGRALCSTCYNRWFKRRLCSRCGQNMRAHIQDANSVCDACVREHRTCLRCGKPTPRAGLLVNGKAVCNACAPYFRKPGVCSRCGGKSTRLSKISGIVDQPVCEKCQRELICATCRDCGKHRQVYHRDQRGQAICKSCADNPGISHACPTCGVTVPGSGASRCRTCARNAAISRQADLLSVRFHNINVKRLWASFSEWLIAEGKRDRVSLTSYAAPLAKVDFSLNDVEPVENAHFASTLTAGELRQAELLTEYLARIGLLTSNSSDRAKWSDEQRIASMVATVSHMPWGKEIEAFSSHLRTAEPQIAPQSRRVYMRAAVALMEFAAVGKVSQVTDETISMFVRKKPGHRASLSRWLRFLAEKHQLLRSLPKKKSAKPKTMKGCVDEVGVLLDGLGTSSSSRTKMAYLSKLLSVLYAVPLLDILHLEFRDLIDREGSITIKLRGQWVHLDRRLENWVRWLLIENNSSGTGYLFPGRLHGDVWSQLV